LKFFSDFFFTEIEKLTDIYSRVSIQVTPVNLLDATCYRCNMQHKQVAKPGIEFRKMVSVTFLPHIYGIFREKPPTTIARGKTLEKKSIV
jgi:hypothetical protein